VQHKILSGISECCMQRHCRIKQIFRCTLTFPWLTNMPIKIKEQCGGKKAIVDH